MPQEQQLGAGTEYAGGQGSDQRAANRGQHTIVVGRRTNNHPGATVSRGPRLAYLERERSHTCGFCQESLFWPLGFRSP